MIVQFSLGFIFGNVLGACLKFFPQNAAMSVALQTGLLMLISASGLFMLTQVRVEHLSQFGLIYFTLAATLCTVMYFANQRIFAITA